MGRLLFILIFAFMFATRISATEPNETVASATVLSPGVMTVSDGLFATGSTPDTLLGARDQFGNIHRVDDDGSPVGSGSASGLEVVPTNSGSIDFAITGYGDNDFIGAHSEAGNYEVFVDVYDFFDDLVDSFSEVRRLDPGIVHEYSFSNFDWIGGTYDVYINHFDNHNDIDFFTFTGLTPGQPFTARTLDPEANAIDTLLGWFNDAGELVEVDDDDGGGTLSRIDGMIPAGGALTFAVTGYGDDDFLGSHTEFGAYDLTLELIDSVKGDYNVNHKADAADYTVWRDTLGTNFDLNGNGDESGTSAGIVDTADYNLWKASFGNGGSGGATGVAIPEPSTLALFAIGCAAIGYRRR